MVAQDFLEDGQFGAVMREVTSLRRTLWRFYDVQQVSAAMAAVLVTCTCGAVATLVRPISAQIVEMGDTVCT